MPQLSGDTSLRLVTCIDDVFEMKRWMGERREILGVDTETTGLDPWENKAGIRLIQLGDHKSGWAVPYEMWGGAAMELLRKWDGMYTLHNAAFDAKWLEVHTGWKIPWHRTHDTMIMSQIDSPNTLSGLKTLATKYVDPRADSGEKDLKAIMKKNNWGWHNIPIETPEFYIYSALDPVLAAHLWSHLRVDLKYPEPYDLEMAYRRIATDMEIRGMRIDVDYAKEKFHYLQDKVDQSKQWAQDNWGISIGSNPQLADFYKNQLGATFEVFSAKTQAPSVNKEQLALFENSSDKTVREVTRYILSIRNAEKMSNSYFKNFIEMNHDGILHPSIKTMGARTGRSSITNPALQTLPKGDSLIRGAFIPRHDGDALLSCDYSQVEARLLAHFSKDKKLQDAFHTADRTGGDFFVEMGKICYRDPRFQKSDSRRGLMKGLIYGSAYGSGVQKMADTAGVPYEDMKEIADEIFTAFPGIKQFMKDTELLGDAREKEEGQGYVLLKSGRRLPSDFKKSYTLTNYMLQGTAAELLKRAVVRMDAAGLGTYFQVPVHDEMIFSMPEHMVQDAMPEIESLMSYTDGEYAVDLLAEPEYIGTGSWGSKYAA